MNLQQWVLLVLALAVVAGAVRLWHAHRLDPRGPRAWRLLALLVLQPLLAGALYLTLFPPQRDVDPVALVLLTEGASAADAARADGIVLALPEAGEAGDVPRVPDLATALRRHPGSTRVQVLGAGLTARDRDAARTVSIAFAPPPLTPGIVHLAMPQRVTRGASFAIAGQVEAVAAGNIELRDPAGRRVDAVPLHDDGRFLVRGIAMEAGAARFELRLVDADGATLSQVAAPLWIEAATPPRVLLLAGAPGPETRALRRWLVDAGAQVQARIALGGGLQLGSAPLGEAALAEADLVIADARAWSGLGEGGRVRVLASVRAGMGLLLRADTTLPGASLRGVNGKGFTIAGGAGSAPWALPPARVDDEPALRARLGSGSRDAPFDLEQAQAPLPALARRGWRVQGEQAVAFAPGDGMPPGWWRAEGRGRIGLWTLLDSYVLPLHGRADLYDDIWSPVVATLARARTDNLPVIDAGARVGERISVCGWPPGATVEVADGSVLRPLVDPASGSRSCAGIWPSVDGWHQLRLDDAQRWFHVAAADADEPMRLAALRDATLALAASPSATDAKTDAKTTSASPVRAPGQPGPAWPWFLLWLLLAGLAWWLERSRVGLAASGPVDGGEVPRHPGEHRDPS
ncbi:hypothetical protein ACW5EG_05705 [Luteimonas sp. A611]